MLAEATLAIFTRKGPKTGRESGFLLLNAILKTECLKLKKAEIFTSNERQNRQDRQMRTREEAGMAGSRCTLAAWVFQQVDFNYHHTGELRRGIFEGSHSHYSSSIPTNYKDWGSKQVLGKSTGDMEITGKRGSDRWKCQWQWEHIITLANKLVIQHKMRGAKERKNTQSIKLDYICIFRSEYKEALVYRGGWPSTGTGCP